MSALYLNYMPETFNDKQQNHLHGVNVHAIKVIAILILNEHAELRIFE